jgi:hypothetical protein
MFVIVVLIAVACAGIGVYYLIPGIPHILIFSISGNPNSYHLKHALVFFGLAVLALLGVRYVQPRPAEKMRTRPLTGAESKQGKNRAETDNT